MKAQQQPPDGTPLNANAVRRGLEPPPMPNSPMEGGRRRRSGSFERIARSDFLENCFFMADDLSVPPDGKSDGIDDEDRLLFFSVPYITPATQINVVRAVKALTDLASAFSSDPVDVVTFDNNRVACCFLGSLRLCLFGKISESISTLRQRLRNLAFAFRLLHGSYKLVKRMLLRPEKEALPLAETRKELVSCFRDIGAELMALSASNYFDSQIVAGTTPGSDPIDSIFIPLPYTMMSVMNTAVGSFPRPTGYTVPTPLSLKAKKYGYDTEVEVSSFSKNRSTPSISLADFTELGQMLMKCLPTEPKSICGCVMCDDSVVCSLMDAELTMSVLSFVRRQRTMMSGEYAFDSPLVFIDKKTANSLRAAADVLALEVDSDEEEVVNQDESEKGISPVIIGSSEGCGSGDSVKLPQNGVLSAVGCTFKPQDISLCDEAGLVPMRLEWMSFNHMAIAILTELGCISGNEFWLTRMELKRMLSDIDRNMKTPPAGTVSPVPRNGVVPDKPGPAPAFLQNGARQNDGPLGAGTRLESSQWVIYDKTSGKLTRNTPTEPIPSVKLSQCYTLIGIAHDTIALSTALPTVLEPHQVVPSGYRSDAIDQVYLRRDSNTILSNDLHGKEMHWVTHLQAVTHERNADYITSYCNNAFINNPDGQFF